MPIKDDNIIQKKSFEFAIKVVNLYRYLCDEKREYVLSKQILKSGTSIGANIEEAIGAQSTKDFVSKMSISYKEARETVYWIKLLQEGRYLTEGQFTNPLNEANEICSIINRIKITASKRL